MSTSSPLSALASGRAGRTAMAAAVFLHPGNVVFRKVPMPECGPHEVRVRLEGCGVCPESVAAWRGGGDFPYPPGAPGSEAWGRVEAVGREVKGIFPGDRVGVLTHAGFAEYAVVDAGCAVVLPETLDGEPFPARALGGAVNVFRRSFIDKGQTVAILGFGFLGALLTQLAVLAEARVVAVGRRPYALRIARQLGASATVLRREGEAAHAVDAARAVSDGGRCDVVIETSGTQESLDIAGELTRERGRLVVAGTHRGGPRSVDMELWNRRGFDVVNAHESSPEILREGMREAAAAVACGLLKPGPLYTHRFSLERLDDALRLVAERPTGLMKALVCF